jgi:hypothetical protein
MLAVQCCVKIHVKYWQHVQVLCAAILLNYSLFGVVQTKDAAKGRFWFLESDLRAGAAVKMDKTGKSMLMLLRHLGRLQEVRTHLLVLMAL